MKITDPRHPWQKLAALARSADRDSDASAPFGFASRVAALAFAQPRPQPSLFELFAFRALGAACILMLLSLAMNYSSLMSDSSDIDATLVEGESTVALLLE